MKIQRLVALTILLLLMAVSSYSQTIETKRNRFYIEGEKMSTTEIISMMKPYPEAHKMMKTGVATGYLSIPVVTGGMILIMNGWMQGMDLFGVESEANYTMIGVGAGLTLVGIIMAASAKSQRSEAIDLYNSSVKRDAFHSSKTNWQLKVTGTGLTMKLKF